MIALAARLRREGHAVKLVATSVDEKDYGPLCRSLDVPLRRVPEGRDISVRQIAKDAGTTDPSKLLRALVDQGFFPLLEEMYAAALELCAESDVVVGLFSSWYMKAAATRVGVPFVGLHYYPGIIPSRHALPLGLPGWKWLNRPAWALFRGVMNLGFRGPAAKFFASKGLPLRDSLRDTMLSDRLNLIAASPSFWPPAPDWGDLNRMCGEFRVSEEIEPWEPSPSLSAFLEAGEKPVLISLGSMEHMAPERARELVVASAREAKVRTIIQTKLAGAVEGQDGSLYFLPWAPHRRLFPLCSAVVHHGGAGTTHAVLRAGKPAVVVPFIFEQGRWAQQLRNVGVAPKAVPFRKATPAQVTARIREMVETESFRHRAEALSRAMAGEDGTGTAVRLLERL